MYIFIAIAEMNLTTYNTISLKIIQVKKKNVKILLIFQSSKPTFSKIK